ncbi:MAG: RluA family pseudouridine synthase [Deltaproteobacteria bacterium]|nr:RluA family pseudouridine synthase [Deltaproteobacteria bacterium]
MTQRAVLARAVLGPEHAGLRMDHAASRALEFSSRNGARREIKAHRILLNGQVVETSRIAKAGGELTLLAPDEPPPALAIDIPVVWIDEHLAVVLKPAGLITSGNHAKTLARAVPHNIGPSSASDALPFARPVHRLDARTSGLVLVARTRTALVGLGRALQERHVQKRYRAVVGTRLEGEGVIESPVDGKEARSRWAVVQHSRSIVTDWATTLDLWPETGRTHQLRVHCASLGAPILGDDLYGNRLRGQGLFLSAVQLDLVHPATGEPLHVEVPEPAKFTAFREREAKRYRRWRT